MQNINCIINLVILKKEYAMKNFLKGTGAAIGYFIVYFVINLLVIFIGGIYVGIKAGFKAAGGTLDINLLTDYITNNIYENAMLFTLIAGIITLFVYYLIIIAWKTPIKDKLDLYPVPFKSLWPIIPLGITLNLFVSHLVSLLPIPQSVLDEYSAATNVLGDKITIVQVLAVIVMAPILEEIAFRGLIMKSLHRGMPIAVALIIQSIMFGFMHGQLIWICYATFFGIILAIIKLRYKSLYPAIILHFMFNLSNYILRPLYSLIPDNSSSDIIIFSLSAILSVFLAILVFKKTVIVSSFSDTDSCNFTPTTNEEMVLTEIYKQ